MENIQSELYLYTIRQKTSVKRGGTNPKAKNYKSVSKSILKQRHHEQCSVLFNER